MQMRWEKQQSKTSNQLVLCFTVPFQNTRHSTASKWRAHMCVCVCACVRGVHVRVLAQMCYLFRHASDTLQCCDIHIIKVCSATVQLSILLFPSAFQMAALREITPTKILHTLPPSSILNTCPSHPS